MKWFADIWVRSKNSSLRVFSGSKFDDLFSYFARVEEIANIENVYYSQDCKAAYCIVINRKVCVAVAVQFCEIEQKHLSEGLCSPSASSLTLV